MPSPETNSFPIVKGRNYRGVKRNDTQARRSPDGKGGCPIKSSGTRQTATAEVRPHQWQLLAQAVLRLSRCPVGPGAGVQQLEVTGTSVGSYAGRNAFIV